jgi:DNA-binding SARP family transcriptional activator
VKSPVFLQTKLHPTQVVSRSLNRTRLIAELTREADARVVLVTGPAGSGKSTLMADFVAQRVRRTAWLGLGEEDQDPHVFFSYFLESLCQQFKGSCEQTRNQLQAGEIDAQDLCSRLINELFAYAEPVSIVLDDYHLVNATPQIREFLQWLCRRGPSNLTLFIVTRDMPELPLSWLRSKRLLSEVHYDSLRFSWEETAELFRDIWGQNLEADLIGLLVEKTEGWATGLQLVAQTIRHRSPSEVRKAIESLEGREDTIYTYLATEVFESQPAAVQTFLKYSAVPDAFNVPLAQALVGDGDVTPMLEHLQNARLFLVKLDRAGDWFRYHHLFRDFLRSKLLSAHGRAAVETLHRKTAEWLYDHNEIVASIPHYLAAGDPALACQILENVGSDLLHRGLKSSLSRWLEGLPQHLRSGRPGMLVLQCELWDLQGQWPKAVEGYKKALEEFRRQGDERCVASVLEKLALCYMKYGDTKQLLATCEEGLRSCPKDQVALRSLLQSWLGATLINSGKEWARGYDLIQEAHTLAYETGDPRAISWATMSYGFGFHFPQGNFGEALRTLNEGIDFFSQLGWPMALYQLVMNKVLVLIMMGAEDEAQSLIDETLIQTKRMGHTFVEKGLENLRGMAYLESRQFEACRDSLSKISQAEIPAQIKPWFFRNRMLLHCHLRNLDQARVDAEEMERVLLLHGAGMYAPECFVSLGYLLVTAGEFDEAVRRLEFNLKLCATARSKFWEMKTFQILAWCHWQAGETESCLDALARSLKLAESNNYDAYWLNDSWSLGVQLLMVALAELGENSYAERLLALKNDELGPMIEVLLQSPLAKIRRVAAHYMSKQPHERNKALLKALYASDPDQEVRQIARKSLRVSEHVGLLEIRALGVLRIVREGEQVEYGRLLRPMAVRLLKYFVTNSNKLVPSDRILDIFWPDLDPERGRHNLATHLSNMRRSLGITNLFQRVGDSYRLCPTPELRLDSRLFEEAVASGLEAAREGQPPDASRWLEQAENLYRGDLLEEDLYEDFIDARRQELRQLFDQSMEVLGDLYMQSRHFDKAASRYRKLLAAEEPVERVFPKLFRCYEAMGDRQGIRREFELLRARLRDMCGVEPQPATRALVDSLFLSN